MVGINNGVILSVVLQITILSLLNHSNYGQQEQIGFESGICTTRTDEEDISVNGLYHDNIVTVLNTLINQSSLSRFFNTSSGSGANTVNGQFYCRPDLDLDTCNSCVNTAVTLFNRLCYNKKQAIVWYQQCMVRYTNDTISPTLQIEPSKQLWTKFNVTQPKKFPDIRNKTLNKTIATALLPGNNRFATGSESFTKWEGFYAMVWCIPDITLNECKTCLSNALDRIPSDLVSQQAIVLIPSCFLKYDTVKFIFPVTSSPLTPANR